jgi:hypothetical protein
LTCTRPAKHGAGVVVDRLNEVGLTESGGEIEVEVRPPRTPIASLLPCSRAVCSRYVALAGCPLILCG